MNNRHERDFIRLIVIALVALAILFSLSVYSVFGPVYMTVGPINVEDSGFPQ